MSSDQFLIALGIVAAVGIGGLTLYKNIAGEMCLLLALVAGTVSLMAYMLTWPVTGTGGIVMSQTILVAAILCGVVHYVCAEEREKEREKLWPRIRMKCLNFTLFSDPLNNPHEGLLVIDLHFTNTGKPTALNEWELRCYFTDGSSYGVGSASLRAQDDYQGIRNIARMQQPLEQLRTGALIARVHHANLTPELISKVSARCTEVSTGKVHSIEDINLFAKRL